LRSLYNFKQYANIIEAVQLQLKIYMYTYCPVTTDQSIDFVIIIIIIMFVEG